MPDISVSLATYTGWKMRHREDYLHRVQQAAEMLVPQRYLLAEDLPTIREQASQRYDLLQSRVNV